MSRKPSSIQTRFFNPAAFCHAFREESISIYPGMKDFLLMDLRQNTASAIPLLTSHGCPCQACARSPFWTWAYLGEPIEDSDDC